MPVPIMAPMPSAVRLSQPNVFLRRFSGFSASASSLSMLLMRNSCEPKHHLPRAGIHISGTPHAETKRPHEAASLYPLHPLGAPLLRQPASSWTPVLLRRRDLPLP